MMIDHRQSLVDRSERKAKLSCQAQADQLGEYFS